MSLGESIYLAVILFLFVAFIVLMGSLSWLDARDERVKRKGERATQASGKAFVPGAAIHR